MKNFKAFLTEGAPYQKVQKSDLPALFKGEFSQSFKRITEGGFDGILRGNTNRGDYFIKEPAARRSAYADNNLYTLMIDNLPSWVNWRGEDGPTRSNGIICTNDFKKTEDYGDPYLVLPANNAKIVVCPGDDIWYSFNRGLKDVGNSSNPSKIVWLTYALDDMFRTYLNIKLKKDCEYKEFEDALEKLTVFLGEYDDFRDVRPIMIGSNAHTAISIMDAMKEKEKSILNILSDWLDPRVNNFKLYNSSTITVDDNSHEIYTSSKCLVIAIPDEYDPDSEMSQMKMLLHELNGDREVGDEEDYDEDI